MQAYGVSKLRYACCFHEEFYLGNVCDKIIAICDSIINL